MILYHGTTRSSAVKIRIHGFTPRRPSRRVWFARHRGYAWRRAQTKARRAQDHPVVLKCDIHLETLRAHLGSKRVINQNAVVAIGGPVPASVLCEKISTNTPPQDVLNSAAALTSWLNEILNLRPHKGIGQRHPGIRRLLLWMNNRLSANPRGTIGRRELLSNASQWLPEFFAGVEVDFEHLRTLPMRGMQVSSTAPIENTIDEIESEDDEEEILDCLLSEKPRRRVRGLQLLAAQGGPDLFDWSMMFLGEADLSVQVAALEAMRASPDVNPALITDLADDDDRRVRAAALEVLAACEDETSDTRKWLWARMTDPDAHVRMTMVKHLSHLDPADNHDVFEAALHDPNPEIARFASRLTSGKGFRKAAW